jgi:hypothetical protein
LFHGPVKLNAVTVWVEHMGGVVDAGVEFERYWFTDFAATFFEELHRILKLSVIC